MNFLVLFGLVGGCSALECWSTILDTQLLGGEGHSRVTYRNGGGGIRIAQISVMKEHGPMLLALRGGGIRF